MYKIESIKKNLRHEKWREMSESYLSSGKTVTEWCTENGISKKTFYYRLRQIRKDVLETSAIEVSLNEDLQESYDVDSFRSKIDLLMNHFIDMAVQGYGWIAAAA